MVAVVNASTSSQFNNTPVVTIIILANARQGEPPIQSDEREGVGITSPCQWRACIP
jgi:hypothetical protein